MIVEKEGQWNRVCCIRSLGRRKKNEHLHTPHLPTLIVKVQTFHETLIVGNNSYLLICLFVRTFYSPGIGCSNWVVLLFAREMGPPFTGPEEGPQSTKYAWTPNIAHSFTTLRCICTKGSTERPLIAIFTENGGLIWNNHRLPTVTQNSQIPRPASISACTSKLKTMPSIHSNAWVQKQHTQYSPVVGFRALFPVNTNEVLSRVKLRDTKWLHGGMRVNHRQNSKRFFNLEKNEAKAQDQKISTSQVAVVNPSPKGEEFGMEAITSEFFLQQPNLFPGFPILLPQPAFLPLQDPTRQYQFSLRPKSPQSSPTLRGTPGESANVAWWLTNVRIANSNVPPPYTATGGSGRSGTLQRNNQQQRDTGDRREGLQTPVLFSWRNTFFLKRHMHMYTHSSCCLVEKAQLQLQEFALLKIVSYFTAKLWTKIIFQVLWMFCQWSVLWPM